MLGHTKKLLTKGAHPVFSTTQATAQEEPSTPWREVAKKNIEKYTEVGALVRGGRHKANLTQKALAEEIGVNQHHISEMEHGKRPIGKKIAIRLAKVFDVDYRLFL